MKSDTSTVTAALVNGNVGSTITSNTKVAVAGVATFAGMAINAAPGSYNLIFTDGALASATTTLQTAVSVGAAAKPSSSPSRQRPPRPGPRSRSSRSSTSPTRAAT